MKQEIRNLSEPVEFRAKGDKIVAGGYAAKFRTLSQNLGGFVETIEPGTFAKTIQEADVRALFNHDPNMLLGRNKSGTLRMEEDGTGLAYEIDLPDTTVGRDVATLLERGDISGSSFGFRTIEDEWGETESGFPLRTLKSVALRDVSPVVYPAYVDTDSAIRSLAESRSLDLEELRAAADKNELQALLSERSEAESEDDEQDEDDDRAQPIVVRRKFAHLL